MSSKDIPHVELEKSESFRYPEKNKEIQDKALYDVLKEQVIGTYVNYGSLTTKARTARKTSVVYNPVSGGDYEYTKEVVPQKDDSQHVLEIVSKFGPINLHSFKELIRPLSIHYGGTCAAGEGTLLQILYELVAARRIDRKIEGGLVVYYVQEIEEDLDFEI